MDAAKPLVLDIDGTFLRTDMLFECFWKALGTNPGAAIVICARNFTRPANLKQDLAQLANLRTDLLPVNTDIQALAAQSQAAGREVVLASASDRSLVAELAETHGLSTTIFASDGETNLKGGRKADQLVAHYGEQGFDYAGNESADSAIWDRAEHAVMVGTHPSIRRDLMAQGKIVTQYVGGWKARDLMRALRPHQWVKNVLLLLPMLAAHDISVATLLLIIVGMASFSAAASAIYIVNDLLDLEADRLHSTKHRRPFASGAVPISVGMITTVLLGTIALVLGWFLGLVFFGVVASYMMLSLVYSLRLKRMRWVDIATLATLYTLRVVAGAAAGQVFVSGFMLVFIFPVFITLGCVKRLTELTLATSDDRLPGRGYGRKDRGDLRNVAALGSVGALLIFFLYTFSPQAFELYPTRWMLWVAMVPMGLWLLRMLRLGYFGKQDDDPIVFAMRDKRGIGLLLLTLSLMFYAAGLWQQWFGLVV